MYRHFIITFFALISLLSAGSFAQEASLNDSIKKLAPVMNSTGTIDYKSSCATCIQNNSSKSVTLYSKDNNQNIELSALTEAEAKKYFKLLASQKDIPFGFPLDGCYARAHKMVQILEEKGVIAGKAFIEGNLFVDTPDFGVIQWGYHVAPVVMVKVGNTAVPYIFDPSLFNKAVPYEAWKAKILEKKSTVSGEYFTNRFAYDPDDRDIVRTSYTEASLEETDSLNENYTELLALYKASKSN